MMGSVKKMVYHKNLGNARYCETCGRSTAFLKGDFEVVGTSKTWI